MDKNLIADIRFSFNFEVIPYHLQSEERVDFVKEAARWCMGLIALSLSPFLFLKIIPSVPPHPIVVTILCFIKPLGRFL